MPRGHPGRTPKPEIVEESSEKEPRRRGRGAKWKRRSFVGEEPPPKIANPKKKDERFLNYNLPGPGPGRPKGSRNKLGADVKELVLLALANAGGLNYLVSQANQPNPSPFMALLAKCMTNEISAAVEQTVDVRITFVDE